MRDQFEAKYNYEGEIELRLHGLRTTKEHAPQTLPDYGQIAHTITHMPYIYI